MKREDDYYINPNKCGYCEKVLSYDKRKCKYCSRRCSAIKSNLGYNRYNRIPIKNRTCRNCGGSLHGKSHKLKSCSNTCRIEYSMKEWLTKVMFEKKMINDFGRNYYLNDRGMKCEECGWDKINPYTGKHPLNIEHIDGDCTNNIPENIKVLCPSCHSLTPTYGSLNRGKSKRVTRYKNKY